MTVRVTTLKGIEAGRYYTERLPSYYLDAGEPPGRWWGAATEDLGLTGDVVPEAFLALMAGKDPDTGTDLGRRYGEESVRGYDATFSAPKSVSLLWALGDERIQEEVLEAHDGAVDATLGWIESHAHTRLRRNGHVVCVDTEGLVVGAFRQHTSRLLDPQLHTHAVIANRVKASDGRWLALDARTIKIDQRTVSALYHANLRSDLTSRLGVEWHRPENGIAEIEGIPDHALAEFSQRTRDVDRRLSGKLERFRDKMRRDPSAKERWRLERQAVLDSRPPKPHGIVLSDLRDDWQQRTVDLGYDPVLLVRRAMARRLENVDIGQTVDDRMVDAAIESLGERQSAWRPAELVRELAAAVPTTTAVAPAELTATLDRLAAETADSRCVDISRPIPVGVERRRDGRPITEATVNRALTTGRILDEEEGLEAWAQRRHGQRPLKVQRLVAALNRDLSSGQIAAANAVAGRGGLELIVGPAGAGKTTALAAAVKTLQIQQRAVFGTAPTATAAEVLASETGMAADTVDKLLTEHALTHRGPSPRFDLPAGATLVVDEAGTIPTPKLAELARLSDDKDWRVVLVGDPRQFAPVGRGGMFGHLVDTLGAVNLDEVHRFLHEWERAASLRLRAGDPAVLDIYQGHGRIHFGALEEMQARILEAWNQARDAGRTVALMASGNETVSRLNNECQQLLIDIGHLDPDGRSLKTGDQVLHEGDEVVTRRNNRTLRTSKGLTVKNRDHWTITSIHDDGSVTVTGPTGTLMLPVDYVAKHLELGYAQTSHASQGRTVQTALLLIDTPTDRRGVYTPMTRGRDSNHAYVAIANNQSGVEELIHAVSREWVDMPAVARRGQLISYGSQQPNLPRADGLSDVVDQRASGRALERVVQGLDL